VTGAKTRKSNAGFTLVELATVVAIIGVLAVLAMVSYSRYMRHAKIAEGQEGVNAIKIAQEDYRAERGTYLSPPATWCPALGGVYDKKAGWDPTCGGFSSLPVHLSGAVQFQYITQAGTGQFAGAAPIGTWVTVVTAPPPGPWFAVGARADLDGQTGNDTQLASFSFSNEIFSINEGQ
jgi:prepilin-type N-terminal cleavage/methylation domain-containing protein